MKAILKGFFCVCVCPSGIDRTAAKAWIVAQESAMCPTDGPSKYEGTSCTDGRFCLGTVSRQMAKSAEDGTPTNECLIFKTKHRTELFHTHGHTIENTKKSLTYASTVVSLA